jgi:two-component system chemotaxis response regulator CheY
MNVLLIDDSSTMRTIVKRKLREAGYGDWSVTEARSGDEAFELSQASPPDLFLCDWNMPGMNGLDLLKKLRSSGCSTRFGFVTSETRPEMRAKAFEAGALFLIAKPFSAEDFQLAFEQAGLEE